MSCNLADENMQTDTVGRALTIQHFLSNNYPYNDAFGFVGRGGKNGKNLYNSGKLDQRALV